MKDINEMDAPTLKARLVELSNELNAEKGIVAAGGKATNPGRIKELRRTIARIHTVAQMREVDLKKIETGKAKEKTVEEKPEKKKEPAAEKKVGEKKQAEGKTIVEEKKPAAAVEKTVALEKKPEAKVSKGIAEIGEV